MPNPSPTVEDIEDEEVLQLTSPEFGSVQRLQSGAPEALILSKNISVSQDASLVVGNQIQDNIVKKSVTAKSVKIVDARSTWNNDSNTVINFSFKSPSPSSPAQSPSSGISAKPPLSTNTKDEENMPDVRMFDDPDAARISEELEKALSAAIRSFQANGMRRLSPKNRGDGKSGA